MTDMEAKVEPELRERLRTLAEASRDSWEAVKSDIDWYKIEHFNYSRLTGGLPDATDAAYIAAANPKTILSLLAELREAENEAGKWHLRAVKAEDALERLEKSARVIDALWDVCAATHLSEDVKHGAITKPLALALVDLRLVLGDYGETQ